MLKAAATTLTSLLLFAGCLYAQRIHFQGKIFDSESSEPIAFASVYCSKAVQAGTISDINGNFALWIDTSTCHEIVFTHTNYLAARLHTDSTIDFFQHRQLLVRRSLTLEEVVILPGPDRGRELAMRCADKLKRHHPLEFPAWNAKVYQKAVFDVVPDAAELDREAYLKALAVSDTMHMMLMETYTSVSYVKPKIISETTEGIRVSGLQRPEFGLSTFDMQVLHFHDPLVRVLENDYYHPFSQAHLKNYLFVALDTFMLGADSCIVLGFRPKRRLAGYLEGSVTVHLPDLAIVHVDASPSDPELSEFSIEQSYGRAGGHWFPDSLRFHFFVYNYPGKAYSLSVDIRSVYRQVGFPLGKQDVIPVSGVELARGALSRDSAFWSEARGKNLSDKELRTYAVLDSLGAKKKFDTWAQFFSGLSVGQVQVLPFLAIDVTNLYSYSNLEGHRPGFGITKASGVLPRLDCYAYAAKGLTDSLWKYGAGASLLLWKNYGLKITVAHQKDIDEPGILFNEPPGNLLFSRRSFFTCADFYQESMLGLEAGRKQFRGGVSLIATGYIAGYPNSPENQTRPAFRDVALRLDFSLRPGARTVEVYNARAETSSALDNLFHVRYEHTFKGLAGGDIEGHRLMAGWRNVFQMKGLGRFIFYHEAGWQQAGAPRSLWFHAPASGHPDLYFYEDFTFQTMPMHTYVATTYGHSFLQYAHVEPLYNLRISRPVISLHQHSALGRLEGGLPVSGAVNTFDMGYFEGGLMVRDLVRINYLNVLFIGCGAGLFYHYGAGAGPRFADNAHWKFVLGVGF